MSDRHNVYLLFFGSWDLNIICSKHGMSMIYWLIPFKKSADVTNNNGASMFVYSVFVGLIFQSGSGRQEYWELTLCLGRRFPVKYLSFSWNPNCQFANCTVPQKMVAITSSSHFLEFWFLGSRFRPLLLCVSGEAITGMSGLQSCTYLFLIRMSKTGFIVTPTLMMPRINRQ